MAEVRTEPGYQEAVYAAMGRSLAAMFMALVAGGLTRDEAMEIVLEWVADSTRGKGG